MFGLPEENYGHWADALPGISDIHSAQTECECGLGCQALLRVASDHFPSASVTGSEHE